MVFPRIEFESSNLLGKIYLVIGEFTQRQSHWERGLLYFLPRDKVIGKEAYCICKICKYELSNEGNEYIRIHNVYANKEYNSLRHKRR